MRYKNEIQAWQEKIYIFQNDDIQIDLECDK
jgi:hypothetical protein